VRFPTVAALLLGLLAGPARGKEDHVELAREHLRRGTALYTLNHYDRAILEFEAGYAESPQPAFLFNLAQAHAKLGDKRLALDFYQKYLELGALPQDVPLVKENIERLTRELDAEIAPKPAPPPPPTPPPTVVAPPPAIEVTASKPPAKANHSWAIGVGIAATVAVIAVVIGLSVGLTAREPGELWSVH
jgi:tetratricopeptide (TPR) repeat protein